MNGTQRKAKSRIAAKALHEAVLPGWEWRGRDDGRWWVWCGGRVCREGKHDCPDRAWFIAIIKALIAKAKETK